MSVWRQACWYSSITVTSPKMSRLVSRKTFPWHLLFLSPETSSQFPSPDNDPSISFFPTNFQVSFFSLPYHGDILLLYLLKTFSGSIDKEHWPAAEKRKNFVNSRCFGQSGWQIRLAIYIYIYIYIYMLIERSVPHLTRILNFLIQSFLF